MTSALALVENPPVTVGGPVLNFAIREINELELRIAEADANTDDLLWRQAAHVAAALKSGMTRRKLAKQWLNVRTGEPYNHTHVHWVALVFSKLNKAIPRPRFRDEYNKVSNRPRVHSGDDEWYTSRAVVDAARDVLGAIDLDPASNEKANEVVGATTYFTQQDNALTRDWRGRVFLNPPYSHEKIGDFCNKLVASVQSGSVSAAVVLVLNTTEVAWAATLASAAAAVFFPSGRLKFWKPNDSGEPAPPVAAQYGSAIFYYGSDPARFQDVFERRISGWCAKLMVPR